jgi:hypothetical protein
MTARRHLIDLRPLRSSRPFREIWSASVLTSMAGQMTAVAALAQVWAVTKSPIWTGAIGLVQGVPILVFGVLGGSLADRLDRRSIILVCTLVQSFIPVALTFQAMLTASSPSLVLALYRPRPSLRPLRRGVLFRCDSCRANRSRQRSHSRTSGSKQACCSVR